MYNGSSELYLLQAQEQPLPTEITRPTDVYRQHITLQSLYPT